MSKVMSDACCAACTRSLDHPCPDFVACALDGPICHDDEACRRTRQDRLKRLRRETLARTAIFVGAGTCGLGAGAGKTIDAVRNYLAYHGIEADIVEVGCIGLCSAEPLVDVQIPGRTRLGFQHVTADRVSEVLNGAYSDNIPTDMLLGQHRHEHLKPYPGVPYLDEHPFFAPQTRWVLANCGLIDPCCIEQLLCTALLKAWSGVGCNWGASGVRCATGPFAVLTGPAARRAS